MDLSSMTKEQRQYAVLGGLVGVKVIYLAVAFGIKPFLQGWEDTRVEYNELKEKLHGERKNVNRTSILLHNLDSSYTNLSFMAKNHIAPRENAYSWVTEKIYRLARDLKIDVETITEYQPHLPWSSSPSVTREFGAYGVRITTSCGYNKLRELVVKLEESNPLLVVSGISVSSSTGNFERHKVQVQLEWPIWMNPEGEGLIRSSDITGAGGLSS